MKICHIIDYFHTDVGYQEYYLALEQARSGHHVQVLTSNFRQHTVAVPGPDEEFGLNELLEAGVIVTRLPGRQLGHDRAWISGLRRTLRDVGPDATHIHGPFAPTTVRAVLTASKVGASVLVDNHIHEAIAPGSRTLANRMIYRIYEQLAGPELRKRVNHWVANGPYEREFLSQRLGLDIQFIDLIPLGFDPQIFGWKPSLRQEARSGLQIGTDETVIAISGKIHPGKRPEAVAQAAEQLAQYRPTRLLMAGSFEPESLHQIRLASPRLHAQDRVNNLGMLGRADLARLYHASDAVVFARLPSISIYEAAGTGTSVLVGKDAFADWLNLQCEAIEPIDSLDNLDLSHLRPESDEIREARARLASDVFTWQRIAADFVELYKSPSVDMT